MNDIEKLRVLLPHWITHNREHGAEFESWAEKARISGAEAAGEIAEQISRAAAACQEVTQALEKAMELAGGPLDHTQVHTHEHGHGHHHHHHEHD